MAFGFIGASVLYCCVYFSRHYNFQQEPVKVSIAQLNFIAFFNVAIILLFVLELFHPDPLE